MVNVSEWIVVPSVTLLQVILRLPSRLKMLWLKHARRAGRRAKVQRRSEGWGSYRAVLRLMWPREKFMLTEFKGHCFRMRCDSFSCCCCASGGDKTDTLVSGWNAQLCYMSTCKTLMSCLGGGTVAGRAEPLFHCWGWRRGWQRRPKNSIQTWQNVIIWSGFALGLYANTA